MNNSKNKIRANSFTSKQILKIIRDNKDFAHAGEEQAIDLALSHLEFMKYKILDVGCGTGGTADYIYQKGWGNVTGIDIDDNQIKYAKDKYVNVSFEACDVIDISNVFDNKFNLILHFNSFYAFNDRNKALNAINRISTDDAKILIFDYVDINNYTKNPIVINEEPILSNLFKLEDLKNDLSNNNWRIIKLIDLSSEYIEWYKNLITKTKIKKNEIIEISSKEDYDYILEHYIRLTEALESKKIGGVCLYAQKIQ